MLAISILKFWSEVSEWSIPILLPLKVLSRALSSEIDKTNNVEVKNYLYILIHIFLMHIDITPMIVSTNCKTGYKLHLINWNLCVVRGDSFNNL